jgi:hypothetical protein
MNTDPIVIVGLARTPMASTSQDWRVRSDW